MPEISGIVSAGPRWIKAAQGDRITCPPLPDRLVVSVAGPGRLEVGRGLLTVAMLRGGRITCPASNVMGSRWLRDTFATMREEVLSLHRDRTTRDALPRRTIDPELISRVSRHVVRRIIGLIHSSRHGAILLFLPPEAADQSAEQTHINIKYQFASDAPRLCFRALVLNIFVALSGGEVFGSIEQLLGGRTIWPAAMTA